jgi:hypothetical protein
MRFSVLLALATLTSCGKAPDSTAESNGPPSSPGSSSIIAASPVVSYKRGQNLIALKDKAPCRESGPDAGEPWKLTKGSTVSFIRVEGSGLRVDSGGGVECVVAAEDVGPS